MAKARFRQLHRKLAPLVFIPLGVTAVTGVAFQMATSWFNLEEEKVLFLLDIHRGNYPGLEKVYPVLNGLGVIAMIVTGLSMTSLFRRRPNRETEGD
ncbi:MAG: hypothetical protein KME08_06820 [Aphanothece sp. CMT-3BRIN-NPC111]|jgi:hypothetical protein|nr:hypothetical protein [Aphanothece sp. CMT-3BRIN-NPC111]